MSKKMKKNFKKSLIFIIIVFSIISLSYIIYADSLEKTTITCHDENLFNALGAELNQKIKDKYGPLTIISAEMTTDGEGNFYITIPEELIPDIVEINLANKEIENITGIEALGELVKVNLAENKIKDITSLRNLEKLTDLNLNANDKLGTYPNFKTILQEKTGLEKLRISNIGLSDISFLSKLKNLKELYMESVGVNNLTEIQDLTKLTTLDVSGSSSITSIEPILSCLNLEILDISGTHIETLEINEDLLGIYSLRNLKELYVRGVEVSPYPIVKKFYSESLERDVAFLAGLEKLDIGYMNKNERVDMISFSDLEVFNNLKVLNMQGNHINSVDGVYLLKRLEEINLAENDIEDISQFIREETDTDDNGIEHTYTVEWLTATSIDLHDNEISDLGVFYKLPTRNQIVNLNLQKNHIYNINALENLTKIKENPKDRLYLQNQEINLKTFYKKIDANQYMILLSLFQQVKNINSVAYNENAEYIVKGCTLNPAQEYQEVGCYNVIIEHNLRPEDTETTEENPNGADSITVTINGGIANGSKTRFIMSEDSDSIDSVKFNDPNLASAIRSELAKRDDPKYVVSAQQILNCNNYLIEDTTELNLLNGNISDLTGLENFFNLRNLNISKNQYIKTIDPIGSCDQMEILNASETSIKDNYSAIENMKNLKKLLLNNIGMTNIGPINVLTTKFDEGTRLEYLDISSNNLDNITGIEKITSLKTLIVTNNPLENVPSLKTLVNLENLSMYENKLKEIPELPELKGLSKLQYVYLSDNKITDVSNLAEIKSNLIELDLSNNLIGDETLSTLSGINISRKLNISRNFITDITPLKNILYTLQELNISKNSILDVGLIDDCLRGTSTLSADEQKIAIEAEAGEENSITIELPPIFASAKQTNSWVYTGNDFILKNCTLSGNSIIIDLNQLGNDVATVQIKGGKADGTTLSVVSPIKAEITYSTKQLTSQNVVATITITNRDPEKVRITNNNGSNEYTFTENGEFTFTYADDYGMTGEAKAEVNWIDNKGPELTVSYNPNKNTKTKGNVTVTIVADEEIDSIAGWNKGSNNKTYTKTYSNNQKENVIVKDLLGNETTQEIEVNNIDRDPPNLEVLYSTEETTTEPVIVTIHSKNEEIKEVEGWTLSSDRRSLTKEYRKNTSENGEIVKVKDLLENEVQVTVIVRNIEINEEEVSVESDEYEITDEEIKGISSKTTVSDVLDNMTIVASEIKVYNSQNQEVSNTSYIGTGMRLVLNEEIEYTFVVKGDTNGDGKTEIQDLVAVNKHRLGKINLNGVYFEAGDVNGDNNINVTDLVLINKARLGKIQL